ncbi:hypothetical protein COY27_01550 [Candidatus Woesearchaeota archaeon CG_4_10_14_0_2_um_filter_33_13]|nr:MAG: hypothetical protein COY27_01550 [Candidatus Woesearchaeota archaeon CG_4_10_14_0_2_um_filter_33_13]
MISIAKYLSGKGIDVSKKSSLSDVKHVFIVPDNTYRIVETELDFIYNDGVINLTKYYRILLKEWFYALKKDGKIIIKFIESDWFSSDFLKEEVELLFGDSVSVIFERKENKKDGGSCFLVLNKNISGPYYPEGINNWSFGIITNGKKMDALAKIIASIRHQNIPNYEIIICGTYGGLIEEDTKYIHFTENDHRGWITKKKNLICDKAKFENLFVLHDRIVLNPGWFAGMKKYGNNFEVLSCKIDHKTIRTYDWITSRYPYKDPRSRQYFGGYLEYSDWDQWIYIDGGAIILKKIVWEKVKWDENLFWNEAEDLKLSHDQTEHGILIRFNPYSTCESLTWRHPSSKLIFKKNKKKLGKLSGPFHYLIGKKLLNYSVLVKNKFKNEKL